MNYFMCDPDGDFTCPPRELAELGFTFHGQDNEIIIWSKNGIQVFQDDHSHPSSWVIKLVTPDKKGKVISRGLSFGELLDLLRNNPLFEPQFLQFKLYKTMMNYHSSLVGGVGTDKALLEGKATEENIKLIISALVSSSRHSKSKIERENVFFWATTVTENGQPGPLISEHV